MREVDFGKGRIGLCYQLSFRFITKEEEGVLVHGRIYAGTPLRWIKHAWVELPTGYVYEPISNTFIRKDEFYSRLKARADKRYSYEEALVMAFKTGHYGTWE